jgi:hypothetical protein
MADIDFKKIGLAAKDIVIGIGAAAAGAQGGPAVAEGVMKAGSGIDNLIGLAVPSEQPPSRAEKFDRTDFSARPVAAPLAAPPRVDESRAAPVDLDAKTTADYLAARGWPLEKVQQILRGPDMDQKKEEQPKQANATALTSGHVEDIIIFDKRT